MVEEVRLAPGCLPLGPSDAPRPFMTQQTDSTRSRRRVDPHVYARPVQGVPNLDVTERPEHSVVFPDRFLAVFWPFSGGLQAAFGAGAVLLPLALLLDKACRSGRW
ncbi:hypothetical protein JM93_01570 [Roseibium hamelinense]|uniref:Uncharacterized protein n=1 Tax=Roseibium hamelinense TaxID=150831 RepID=A0A562T746_9HYPH|nr:hypothetical protein JM93_01570 [Roseibium hamelinense]